MRCDEPKVRKGDRGLIVLFLILIAENKATGRPENQCQLVREIVDGSKNIILGC